MTAPPLERSAVVGERIGSLLDPSPAPVVDDACGSGVVVADGRIDDAPVVVFATDPAVRGGALGGDGARRIAAATDRAVTRGVPVVGLWHSGGARLADGVASLDGVGEMFAALTAASGRVPQISVVLGPAAGAAAYGPALTDVVIMSDAARIFVTGPDVVRSVTGEQIDSDGLGGPDTHSRRSGVAHVVAPDEATALASARRTTALLARPGRVDPSPAPQADPGRALPWSARRTYDVRAVVADLVDGGATEELQARWSPNVVTTLGRLGGGTVGVLATNPLRKGGCLDAPSAEKASRFVRTCDAFGVPMVVLVDVPGYLPGVDEEWGGVVRRGAKLLHAFAAATVPRVTVITRKAYGGAYVAMNARSMGATAVFAWPDAEVAVMSDTAAVKILHRRRLADVADGDRDAVLSELAAEHRRTAGGLDRARDLGAVDAVIPTADTRTAVAAALAGAARRPGPVFRHDNIPL